MLRYFREKVYFDGYLPPSKSGIRLERLRSYLKQLNTYHALHTNGLQTWKEKAPLSFDTRHFFDTFSVQHTSRGLPATPFLVPAVIETLLSSQYAQLVEIVPGEADSYCAQAARRSGGIVLTSDSDLLIHDLGSNGAVAFFSQVQLLKCDGCDDQKIMASVSVASEISRSLGLKDLLRLGFEIKEDPSVTLAEAVRRAKERIAGEKMDLLHEFCLEYREIDLRSSSSVDIYETIIDPRISELVLQVHSKEDSAARMYLPFLIEDPTRASAWSVASEIRSLAYSLLLNSNKRNQITAIQEYSRRGGQIMPLEMSLMDPSECTTYAKMIIERRKSVVAFFQSYSETSIWRAMGLIEVYAWYIAEERTLPSDDLVTNAVNRERRRGLLSWQEIHLSAQLQAALYSMRIASQVLAYTETTSKSPKFPDLTMQLQSLPALEELFPPRSMLGQMQLDIGKIKAMAKGLRGLEESSVDDMVRINGEETQDEASFEKPRKTIKKRRGKGGKKDESPKPRTPVWQSSNMYDMLDNQ